MILTAMDEDTVHAWVIAGRCYEDGLELDQSLLKAVQYYTRAADAGHAGARLRVEQLLDTPVLTPLMHTRRTHFSVSVGTCWPGMRLV